MLSERDLKRRLTGIGASECAIAADLDPYSSKQDLWNAKVFGTTKPQTNAMRAGNFLEEGVAQIYLSELALDETRSWKLRRARTRRHASRKWMLATIDREVYATNTDNHVDAYIAREELAFGRVRIAELKLPGSRYAYNVLTGERDMVWGYSPDAIPTHIACQAQWQMEITGDQECDVVAFFLDTRELAIYRQPRNQLLIDSLVAINERFWFDHIFAKVPPPIDGSSGASEYLKRRFPNNNGSIVAAPYGTDEIARAYARARRDEKHAIADKDFYGNQLRELVGLHDGVTGPFGKVMWKRDHHGDIDYKSLSADLRTRVELLATAAGLPDLAADLDALAEKHRDPPSRRLRVDYKLALEDPPELLLVPDEQDEQAVA